MSASFCRVDGRVLRRLVPEPSPPEPRPHHAQGAEHKERLTPAERRHQRDDDRRSNRAAHARAHEHPAVRRPRSATGNHLAKLRDVFGKRASSPMPKQQARDDQRHEVPGQAGRRGKRRPPDDDARQHLARPHDVAHPAARDLKRGVGPREGAEHPPHLHRIQAHLAPHGGCGRRKWPRGRGT